MRAVANNSLGLFCIRDSLGQNFPLHKQQLELMSVLRRPEAYDEIDNEAFLDFTKSTPDMDIDNVQKLLIAVRRLEAVDSEGFKLIICEGQKVVQNFRWGPSKSPPSRDRYCC